MDRINLDGNELLEMLYWVTQLFEDNVETVNDLNVFPVPDGDTGTNMYLTLKDILKAAEQNPSISAGQISASMAKAALMGARGNSGTILSQIFKGLSVELEGRSVLEASDLPRAFQKMSELAYEAVGHPVEGTLLTVISAVAEATKYKGESSLVEIVQTACNSAKTSVAQTTSMLKKLKEAGVVDSGGYGLLIILEGMRRYCMEGEFKIGKIEVPEPIGVEGATGSLEQSFFEDNESEIYGNCIQFLLEGQSLDKKSILASFNLIAESVAVVGDQPLLKIHVHSDNTDKILDVSKSLGQVKNFTVTDMDEQYSQFSDGRAEGEKPDVTPTDVEVVALVWGDGFKTIFEQVFGVAKTLMCKESVSPSVSEITELTDLVKSKSVILLCNNPNVGHSASQVSEMSRGRVHVLETITMPQGISAMEVFDSTKTITENLKTMGRNKDFVRTGVVCFANKSGNSNGLDFSEGDSIALLEQEMTAVNEEPGEVLLELISEALHETEKISIYWGDNVSKVDAVNIRDKIVASYPDVAIEIVRGGQTDYHYIVSFE